MEKRRNDSPSSPSSSEEERNRLLRELQKFLQPKRRRNTLSPPDNGSDSGRQGASGAQRGAGGARRRPSGAGGEASETRRGASGAPRETGERHRSRSRRGERRRSYSRSGSERRSRPRSPISIVDIEEVRPFLPGSEGSLAASVALDDEEDPLALAEVPEVPPLSDDILQVLGTEEATGTEEPEINFHVATRWENVVKAGLGEKTREELIKKYPVPRNCPILVPPKLNVEIKAAVTEFSVKRDERLATFQTQLAAGIAAVGKALTSIVEDAEPGNKLAIIESLNDSGRLLADLHQQHSQSRRSLLSLNLKKEVLETLNMVPVDGWLFGENVTERLRTAKAIERSGNELKNALKKKIPTSKPLNFQGPPKRRQVHRSGGHLAPSSHRHNNHNKKEYPREYPRKYQGHRQAGPTRRYQ